MKELQQFLEKTIQSELKWMYQADGVETDKYSWCKMVIEEKVSIAELLEYFTKYYSSDEPRFINQIKELATGL